MKADALNGHSGRPAIPPQSIAAVRWRRPRFDRSRRGDGPAAPSERRLTDCSAPPSQVTFVDRVLYIGSAPSIHPLSSRHSSSVRHVVSCSGQIWARTMQSRYWNSVTPDLVLDFWFPEDEHETDFDAHRAFWTWRMRGGADDAICQRFADLTKAAAKGLLDHWAETPRGRLALVIALDQFPRSVWRGPPRLLPRTSGPPGWSLKGSRRSLRGPAQRMGKGILPYRGRPLRGPGLLGAAGAHHFPSQGASDAAPARLRATYRMVEDQNRLARDIVARFGRHPHRNAMLGRVSTLRGRGLHRSRRVSAPA